MWIGDVGLHPRYGLFLTVIINHPHSYNLHLVIARIPHQCGDEAIQGKAGCVLMASGMLLSDRRVDYARQCKRYKGCI